MKTYIFAGTEPPQYPDPENLPPDHEWSEANRDAVLWWNPTTGAVKKYNSETEEYDIDVEFLHPQGLSGTKVLDGKQLTFTNGILTGYEVA